MKGFCQYTILLTLLLPADDEIVEGVSGIFSALMQADTINMIKISCKPVFKPDNEMSVNIYAGIPIQTDHFKCMRFVVIFKFR